MCFRDQAVNALLAIHKAGVEHNDFAERNIVVSKNGKGRPHVIIVDFGMADHDHECPVKHDKIIAYDLAPALAHFHATSSTPLVWNTRVYGCPVRPFLPSFLCLATETSALEYVYLFGNLIHVEYATSVDSLLQHCPNIPSHERESVVRGWAQRKIDELAEMWEKRQALDANPVPIQFDEY